MARSLESRNPGVQAGIGRGRKLHISEDAVVAIDFRPSNRLAVHRRNALAQFAGRFGNQLLHPCAQVVDLRRGEDGDLVAAGICGRAQNEAQFHRRIVPQRQLRRGHCLGRLVQHHADIEARHRGCHHPKIR